MKWCLEAKLSNEKVRVNICLNESTTLSPILSSEGALESSKRTSQSSVADNISTTSIICNFDTISVSDNLGSIVSNSIPSDNDCSFN